MKKTLKLLAVVALLIVVLISLTGCGNKLVAKKETTENGVTYKEKTEIKFKDDKIDTAKMTRTYKDKSEAERSKEKLESTLEYLNLFGINIEGIEISSKGKKVTLELTKNAFSSLMGIDVESSKDEVKKNLEDKEYKVK